MFPRMQHFLTQHQQEESSSPNQQVQHSLQNTLGNAALQEMLRNGHPSGGSEVSNELLADLKKGRGDFKDIRAARKEAYNLPKKNRGEAFRKIAKSVSYRNQRDNVGKGTRGDEMCNVTSIAMALNQLGIGANEDKMQFEDKIDRQLSKSKGSSARFDRTRRAAWLREDYNLKVQDLYPQTGNAAQAKKWFHENLLSKFEKGASAIMGTKDRATGLIYNHIVRVEWVEEEGLRVDDPFGKAQKQGQQYTYSGRGNSRTTTNKKQGGAKGENNLWTWEMLAKTHPTYIQVFNTKKEADKGTEVQAE